MKSKRTRVFEREREKERVMEIREGQSQKRQVVRVNKYDLIVTLVRSQDEMFGNYLENTSVLFHLMSRVISSWGKA